jgi:hypothetical protein
MKTANGQPLKDILSNLFDAPQHKSKITEAKIIGAWDEIAGKLIAKQTQKIFVSKHTLFIKVESAALKNELHYTRSKIKELVNTFAGYEFIQDVVIQ